jgi:hypothetical protein
LPALRKLRELVASGAVLVAARPIGGLGILSGDQELSALTEELWGPVGAAPGVRRLGQGRLYAQPDLRAALDAEGIAPDVAVEACEPQCRIRSVHRRTEEADIYFLSNRDDAARATRMAFHAGNRVPELWRADTGRAQPLAFRRSAHSVVVPLQFAAHEAFFVVFRRASARSKAAPPVHAREISRVLGPWQVRFQSARGAPESSTFAQLIDWRTSSNDGIKYFSGAATYRTSIRLPALAAVAGRRLLLDLGGVHELAVVFLDGIQVGTAWHAPFEIELPPDAGPGAHRLEIRVDNLWVNRLIGDRQPGASAVAFAPQSPYTANSPLMPSGLLGPVRILALAP